MIKIQREPTLLVTTNSQDSILAKSIEDGCYEKSRMTSIEEYWDTNIVPAELCKSYHSIPSSNPLPVPETTEENEVMKSINALIKGKDEESKSHEDKESKEFEAGEEEEDKEEEEEDKEEEDKEDKEEEEDKEESKKSLSDVLDDLVKSGEGSRGGKIIGHTKSGKPIYQNKTMDKFHSHVTQHDMKNSKKKGYNRNALGHYAGAMQEARDKIKNHDDPHETIAALKQHFEPDFPPLKKLIKENKPKPEKEENWHTATMNKMKTRTEDELRYIQKDASKAADAMESIDPYHPKSGQYRDEAHYAGMELTKRKTAMAAEKKNKGDFKSHIKDMSHEKLAEVDKDLHSSYRSIDEKGSHKKATLAALQKHFGNVHSETTRGTMNAVHEMILGKLGKSESCEEQIKKGELSFDPVIDDQGVPSNVGDAKFVHDDADLVCLRELVGSGIVPIDDPVIKPILSRVGVIY